MTMDETIKRINELYHKSNTLEGLTEEERAEQAELRQKYILSVRKNLRASLKNVSIVEKDGSITDLKDKIKD